MRFLLNRTSMWSAEQPCPEAVQVEVPLYETRTCSEEVFDAKFSKREGTWRSIGTKHEVLPTGYIRREKGMQTVWSVELPDLPALMAFVAKHGRCVVKREDGEAFIEIYDDYRE